MKKVSWIRFLKFISLLFLMLMLNRSMLFRKIRPFGVASAFALLLCGISPFSVILTYGISSLIFRLSLEGIISIVTECCVMILIIMIQKAIKKKLPTYIYCTLLLISQSAKLYFSFGYIETILSGLASIFVSFISFFIFLISFNSIRKRGKLFKFTIDEKVCHSFLIVTCFSGLEGLYIYNFLLTNVISIMVLFLVSRIFPSSFTIVLSTLSGLGLSLASLSVVPLAMFSIWATMMITFKNNSKIIAGLMVMASDVVMGVFLNTYGVYDLWVMLSTFSGLFVVCLFSDKKLLNLSAIFGNHVDIAKDFANLKHEEQIENRLKNISNVFYEMENLYRSLLIGDIDRDKSIEYITQQCKRKACKNCEKQKSCYGSDNRIIDAFNVLSHSAINKGKVSLLDMPAILTSECVHGLNILGIVNSEVQNINNLKNENLQRNKNSTMVANQLSATGELISEVSSTFNSSMEVDYSKSSDIYEELLFYDINVNDVVCIKSHGMVESVILSVANEFVLNPLVLKSVEKILKLKCKICNRIMAKIAGFTILIINPRENFKFSCGVATASKKHDENSGDSYSILKISDGKYLCAIADGMGSGKSANLISTRVISLIENYYKAGFDSNTIISNVNELLLPMNGENFSTLDSAIIDTSSGRVDFIKIGSSVSLIKKAYESTIIDCESLPLGIDKNAKPYTKSIYVEGGDIIILASDGVVDSFSSIEMFMHYVNNERIQNVQLLAENILEEAKGRNIKNPDDMTVIAIKVVNN